jgi:ribosome-binding factor A
MEFDFTLPGLGRPRSSRPQRVSEAIKNELSVLLLQKVGDPRLRDLTISQVKVTADLKQATIYFSLPSGGDVKKAAQGLERAKGFFRSQLAALLNLRYTPELIFRYDHRNENIERLDELFRQIADGRKADDDERA